MLLCNTAQGRHPGRAVVQAGDVLKLLAACVQKGFACFLVDFFQRFQAVTGKAGADQIDTLGASLCHGNQGRLGIGLQPFSFAKARLEGEHILTCIQLQALSQQACRLVRLAVVGVAQVQCAFRHAMKAHHQLFAAAMAAPMCFNALGQRFDIACVIVVAIDKAQFRNMTLRFGPVIHGIKHTGRGRA